jgi:GGDEF domain-containing protein
MILNNTKVFALGHMILSLFVVVVYIHRSFQTILWILALLILLWGLVLMYFSYTSQLREWIRNRKNLYYIMIVDIILILCVYLLPYYKNTPPLWILIAIIPFYASEFGSKVAIQVSTMGVISIVVTNLLREPDEGQTIIIMVQLFLFIIFVGRKTDQLYKLAFFDVLTGLPNRTYMKEMLDFYLKSTDNSKIRCFYFFLIDEAEALAGKLIHCLDQPLVIDDHAMHTSMSLGVSMFPNDGTDAETLMKKADIAMYEAKSGGRNRYKYFEEA